jgi:hypothetical protein
MDSVCSSDIISLNIFLWGYVKGIVCKTHVTSLDDLKPRSVAVTLQMLGNTCRETEHHLDILHVMKGTLVEAV